MKSEKPSFKIELLESFKRKTSLIDPYEELIIDIRQTGGDWWAEYEVKFTPNSNPVLNVSLTDKAEKKYDYLGDCFHQGIKKGLLEFVEQLNKRGIGLGGMNIMVANLSYHPVDSKSLAYTYTLLEVLNRLENSSKFKKEIIETEQSSSFYETMEVEFDRFKDPYLLKETHISIISPRVFKQTIKLKKRVQITLNDLGNKQKTYQIVLSPNFYDNKRRYSINLEFRNAIESNKLWEFSNHFNLFSNQIKEILETINTKNYNLGGLYILIVPLFDQSKEPFVKSNKEYLKWVILNTLLNNEYIEIKKEPFS